MKYFIWSHRHSEWWGPDHGGYTLDMSRAGTYTRDEAAGITIAGCLPGANVAVAENLRHRFDEQRAEQVEAELDTLRRL